MIEINNTTKQLINEAVAKKLVKAFLKFYRKEQWSVSIAIINSEQMKNFNEYYRGIKKTTDVLSFSGYLKDKIGPAGESKYLGEVLLNLSEIKKTREYQSLLQEIQAISLIKSNKISKSVKKFNNKLSTSNQNSSVLINSSVNPLKNKKNKQYLFHFLLIHGLLHLIGYNDSSKIGRREMLYQGKKFLSQQGQELDFV